MESVFRNQPATVDTDTFHPHDESRADVEETPQASVLALPVPHPAVGGGAAAPLGYGQRVQMDHLGPMVVGEHGELSRIANWDKLTEREKEIALRRITARNRERLQKLGGEGTHAAGGQQSRPIMPGGSCRVQANSGRR